jgi:hypothetical protein
VAQRKGLRAVGKLPNSVAEAAIAGDQRGQLVAMRARIARAIDDPEIRGADLAALSRRLLEVAKEIDAIDLREAEEARESADATPDDRWEAV